MDTPLLSTKLFIPPVRPGLVSRSRLIERLSESRDCPLIVVSAPAGFGKTTILTQWIAQKRSPRSTAWVSLDEGDSDPVRFWDYIIAALRKLRPDVGETASTMLHSPQPYPLESPLTTLINDLTIAPGDLALVLDDYHLIKTDVIHEGVAFLVDHAPPGMHVVISTRTDPDLPLARLRGRGLVIEMRADDLRFTADEAADLLQELLGTAIPPEQLDALNTKTEGWAVGLKMAALSLQGRPDIGPLVASLAASNRYVMDYLLEEVLRLQSAEVRDFLLKTSVLQKLCGPLCDFLTGGSRGSDMLIELDRANLFLVPLDDTRQWYRYHHLFAELMRHQLEMHCGAEMVTQFHKKASTWYESSGLLDDAIRDSLKAEDFETGTRLIGRVAGDLVGRGEWNTLFEWFQAIPEHVLRRNPAVYAQYANVFLTRGDMEAADSILDYLDRTTSAEQDLQGQLAFLQSIAAYRRGDMRRMTESVQRALEQLPPDSLAARTRLYGILGIFEWGRGALDRAWSRSLETLEIGKRAGDYWITANTSGMLSQILWLRGKLRQALTVGQEAVEFARESPGAAFPGLILGYILYERNELEGAALNSQLSIKLSELGGFAENRIAAYYCLAQGLQAQQEAWQAEESMKRGDEASRHPTVSPMCRAIHVSNRVMLAIRQNDLEAARDWGRQLSEYPLDTQWIWFQHAHARLAIALGDYLGAREQLTRLYDKAIQADARGYAIRIRVYQALAAANTGEAVEFLADALKMGEAEGFVRTFVDEGKLLAPLLRRVIAEGAAHGYAARLLSIVENEERQRKIRVGKAPALAASPGGLSEREMEVLGLVAKGLSDRQIAAKLIISLSTTKTHVHRILEKLGASSRTQAVTHGRELNLI